MEKPNPLETYNQMKSDILANYERLTPEDALVFTCAANVPCFTDCCHDVNIILTPYDMLRLKNRLKVSSEDFIAKFALSPAVELTQRMPIVVLRMAEGEKRPCPFLGGQGCTVYEDRPWACRMYPLGVASQKTERNPAGEEFYFLLKEEHKCKGHGLGQAQTIAQYLDNQGVLEYDRQNEGFKELAVHPLWQSEEPIPPQKIQMFFLALYNLDVFRRFILNSRFFEVMNVPAGLADGIADDDDKLLKFSYAYLKYIMFGLGPIGVKGEVIEKKRAELKTEQRLREGKTQGEK